MSLVFALCFSMQDLEELRGRLKQASTDEERAAIREKIEAIERKQSGSPQDGRERELQRAIEELKGRLKQAGEDEQAAIREKLKSLEHELGSLRKGGFEKRPPPFKGGPEGGSPRERELMKMAEELRGRFKQASEAEQAELKEKLGRIEGELAALRKGGGFPPDKRPPFKPGAEGDSPRERELMRMIEETRGQFKTAPAEEHGAIKERLAHLEHELAAIRKTKPNPGDFERRPGPPPFEKRPGFEPGGPRMPPEMVKLETASQDLGARLRVVKEEKERAALKEELRKTLNQLFDMKEEQRRREVEELTRQIDLLRSQLSARQDAREKIIEKRMKQLSGEGDGLDW